LHHHRPTRAPDRDTSTAVTRGRALRTAALAAGGALATVTALGAADRLSAAPSPEQDVKVLNLLLLVERVQVAFYEAALERAGLTGELDEYARAVVEHEHEHVAYLEEALGDKADAEPDYDLTAVTSDADAFAPAAAKLEDIAVGAYNGQAPNVTPGAFLAAARIVSVEARHAAWIRSIRNGDPAPDAVDAPYDQAKVMRELRTVGLAS
jgi:ferritin-like protein